MAGNSGGNDDFKLVIRVNIDKSYTEMQKDITELITELDKTPHRIKLGIDIDDSTVKNLANELSQITNRYKDFGKAADDAGRAVDRAAKAEKSRQVTLNQVTKAYQNIKNLMNSATDADKGTTQFKTMEREANSLNNVLNTMRTRSVSVNEALRLLGVDGKAAIERAQLAVFDFNTEVKKSGDIIKKGSAEYNTYAKRLNTLYDRLTNMQRKWTAARNGSSSNAYNEIGEYINSIDDWRKTLEAENAKEPELSKFLSEVTAGSSTAASSIRAAGEATLSWSDRIESLAGKFGVWLSISQVIMTGVRYTRQMIDNVIELNSAMTELRKVTDETEAAYDRFIDRAADRAKEIGAALSDVIRASADFARLGYNIEESEILADAAIVYKNVGDIEDIGAASESIISTMQAFNINPDEVMSIVDKFNEVGNNFPISSAGIGEALLRSAAAMRTAGNTLDETIALISAANAIVQNPDSVGTTLKTVSMYLRAAKTEAEEAGESTDGMASSVSELREELLNLTGNRVDIQINEDSFKSTFSILKELSGVWDSLTDVSKANILEMIGGKRNSNVVAALLENFSTAEEVLTTSINSAGSATAENEKVLDSIQGKLNVLQATFEKLSQTAIDDDVIIDAIEGLTELLEILNSIVDTFGTLVTVATAAGAAFGAFDKSHKIFSVKENQFAFLNKTAESMRETMDGLASAGRVTQWKSLFYPEELNKELVALQKFNNEVREGVPILDAQSKHLTDVSDAARSASYWIADGRMSVADYAKQARKATASTKAFEEIQALLEEKNASDEARAALVYLAQQKLKTNQFKINTAEDFDNIINMANAAGASTIALARLARAKEILSKGSLSIGDLRQLESIQAELYSGTFDFGFNLDTTPIFSTSENDAKDEIENIKEELADLDKEASLDNLKQGIEEFTLELERLNVELDILSSKLDLTSEKDYYARARIISRQYDTVIQKGSELRAEFDRLKAIEPQTADEANEIATQLESIGSEMRSNVQSALEYRRELNLINVNALADSAQTAVDNLEKIHDLVSSNNDIWFGDEPSMNGYADAFNLAYLLPTGNVDEVLDRTRRRNNEIEKDEQETQDAITEIKRKALEMQYAENAAAREKSRQELLQDLEEAQAKISETSDAVSDKITSDVEEMTSIIANNIDSTVDKVVGAYDTVSAKSYSFFSDFEQKVDEAKRQAESFSFLTGGAFGSYGTVSYSSDRSKALAVKSYNPQKGSSYATGPEGCVYYVTNWLSNNGIKNIIPSGGSYEDVTASAKTKRNERGIEGEDIDRIRAALKRGTYIAVSSGPDVSAKHGHLLVVTDYDPNSDILTVSEHLYTQSDGDVIKESTWRLPDFLETYAVEWTTPPEYAEGTKSHPGGLAIVGEDHKNGRSGGAELAIFPDGDAALLGTDGAGIYDLPKGTQVLSHDKTKKIIPKYAEGTDGADEISLVDLDDLSKGIYGSHDKETFLELTKLAEEYSTALENIKKEFSEGTITADEFGDKLLALGRENSSKSFGIYLDQIRKRREDLDNSLTQAEDEYQRLLSQEDVDADTLSEAADKVAEIASALSDENEAWQQIIEEMTTAAENYFSVVDKGNDDARKYLEDLKNDQSREASRINSAMDLNGGAVNELQGNAELIDLTNERILASYQTIDSYNRSLGIAEAEYLKNSQELSEDWNKYFGEHDMADLFNADGTTTELFQTLVNGSEGEAADVLQTVKAKLGTPLQKMHELREDILDEEDEILGLLQERKGFEEELLNITTEALERRYEDVQKKIETEIEHQEYLNTLAESRLNSMREYHQIIRSIDDDMIDFRADLESNKLLADWLDPEARENMFNTDDYKAMESAADDYTRAVTNAYNTYQKQIRSVGEGEEAFLEVYQQQYSDALAAAERTYELSKLELEVEKKRRTLENALNERNVRQFIGGRWVYTSNATDVTNAQKDLTTAQTAYNQMQQEILDAREEGVIQSEINDRQLDIAELQITSNELNDVLEEVTQNINDKLLDPLDDLSDVMAWVTNYDYDHDFLGNNFVYRLWAALQGTDPTITTSAYDSPWGVYPDDAVISNEPNYMQAEKTLLEDGASKRDIASIDALRDEKQSNLNSAGRTIINGEIYRPVTSAELLTALFKDSADTALKFVTGEASLLGQSTSTSFSGTNMHTGNLNLIQSVGDRISKKITQASEYIVGELINGLSSRWLNIDTVNVQDDKFSEVMKNFAGLYSVKVK